MPHCPGFEQPAQQSVVTGMGLHHQQTPSSIVLLPSTPYNTLQAHPKSSPWHTTGAVSHVPFQHVTEHSRCNYTRSFPSTKKKKKRQTTWENDNCPIIRSSSEGKSFPRKTQALENKPYFPCANIPWTSLLQHAHGSHPPVTSPSAAPSDRRVQGRVPSTPAQDRGGSGSPPAPAA